jgi:serine/threonine protein kinase/beta-lactam-binding protein with PASTA domain
VVATVSELLVGQLLDGRYRIVARIARGGMATVYEALDTRLHREVAVKVMHASLARDPDFVDRFIREARSAARLSHPNVVAVFDQGSQPDPRTGEDCVYLVMELIRGRTLRQLLRERGPLPAADALAVIEPVLAALRAAHDAGIIHRDVKPENVLLADDGRVEVADFGLARAVNSASGHTMTRGVLLGTVSYLAPEQVVDGSADARTDVYAAGIVLFEMLTGTKPHEGDSPIAVAYKHVNDDVPRPSALRPGIPPAVDRLVRRATDRVADQRFADGREFLAAVRATRDLLRRHPDRPGGGPNGGPGGPNGGPGGGPGAPVTPPPAMAASAPARNVGSNTTAIGLRRPSTDTAAYPRLAPAWSPSPASPLPASPLTASPLPASPTGASAWSPPEDPRAEVASMRRRALARRRRRRGIVAVVVVVVLALILGVAGWYIGDGRLVAVPRLTGLPEAQAEQLAESTGVHLKVSGQRWDETAPAGYVLTASDPAQQRVPRGSTVAVVVSRGPERHVLPTVVGLQETAAAAALGRQDLAVGGVRQIWSPNVPKGQVMASDPAQGSLKTGTKVYLTISRGPQPVELTSVVGQLGPAAAAAVRAAGLGVTTVPQPSDTVPAGQIVSQTPDAGPVSPDTTVTLVLSTGPVPIRIPWSILGESATTATAALTTLGLRVTIVHSLLWVGLNRVVSAGVLPGATVPRGSTVVLTVV